MSKDLKVNLKAFGSKKSKWLIWKKKVTFEDIKGVMRSSKSKKGRLCNGKKKKDNRLSTKQYTEN